jgi:hypothetical protein
MPVSVAMILWQMADIRIDTAITIALTAEGGIVPLEPKQCHFEM